MRLIATEGDPVASGRSPESHFSSRDGASFGMRDACFLLFISAASALSNLFEPNTSFRQGTTPTPTQNNWFSCQLYQDGCRLACPCMTLVSDGLRRIWDSLHPPIAHVPVIPAPHSSRSHEDYHRSKKVRHSVCAIPAVCVCVCNNNKRECACIACTKYPGPASCQELHNKTKQFEAHSIQLPVE